MLIAETYSEPSRTSEMELNAETLHLRCSLDREMNLSNSLFRNSHRRCSLRKGVLRNFAQENTCARVFFFHKVAGLSQQLY